jgi:hypothetical protein
MLTTKFKLGLFENPYGDPANAPHPFHQPSYVALANLGATPAEINDIRVHIAAGQSVPTTYGSPLYPYGAGLQGWQ